MKRKAWKVAIVTVFSVILIYMYTCAHVKGNSTIGEILSACLVFDAESNELFRLYSLLTCGETRLLVWTVSEAITGSPERNAPL